MVSVLCLKTFPVVVSFFLYSQKIVFAIGLVALCTADIGLELKNNPNYRYDAPATSLSHDHDHHDESGAFSAGGETFTSGSFSDASGSFSNRGSYDAGGAAFSGQQSGGAAFDSQHHGPGHVEEEVQKHFYVFGANEEEEEEEHAPIAPPPAKKQTHYKIIFIKAPSQDRARQQILAQAPQRDEKTIVYVLVKKPEDISQIIQQQQENYKPHKPEVFFIKYKGGKGHGHADAQGKPSFFSFPN